jgi:hypothetical protein
VNSHPDKWISRTTKQLATVIVSPILIYAVILPVCWSWSQFLRPGATRGLFFEFCGHDGILPNFLMGISIVLAIFSILLAPISLLLDWRRWKKHNA